MTLIDSGDEPVVVTFPLMTDWYQASVDVPIDRSPPADLLGATRALVIAALADRGDTTTGLARRLEISAASASEHASVLRAANLVTSVRDGNRVVHHLTTLGRPLAGSGTRIDRSGALHRH